MTFRNPIIGLGMPYMGLNRRRPRRLVRSKMVPKRHRRPIRLPALDDRGNTLDLVHGLGNRFVERN